MSNNKTYYQTDTMNCVKINFTIVECDFATVHNCVKTVSLFKNSHEFLIDSLYMSMTETKKTLLLFLLLKKSFHSPNSPYNKIRHSGNKHNV